MLLACDDLPSSPGASGQPPSPPPPGGNMIAIGAHAAAWLDHLRAVPGFAGLYYDGNEDLVVLLKDTAQKQAALARFARFVGRSQRPRQLAALPRQPQIRFLPAARDYGELLAIKQSAFKTLIETGNVTSVGIDEAKNVVQIGVRDQASVGLVARRLADAKVPSAAISIVVEAPARSLSDIDSTHSIKVPIIGGWRLWFYGGPCGMATVRFGSSNTPGLLTARHCTRGDGFPPLNVGDSVMEMSHDLDAYLSIGVLADTAATYACTEGGGAATCIDADVALIRVNSGLPFWLGGVASGPNVAFGPYCRLPFNVCIPGVYYADPYNDPVVYDPQLDSATDKGPYQVDAEQTSTAAVGTWVSKFGPTTGWTIGKIAIAAQDRLSDKGYWVKNAVVVSAGVYEGDSGSPAISGDDDTPGGNHGAIFMGIVYAGDSSTMVNGNPVFRRFIYSPWTQITKALSGYSIHAY
jgi:hypothetical protein